jgi:molybdate transport system substrate-binding protein
LRIAAASDLQLALPRLADRFQRKTGIPATLTFGASGQLSEQIRAGAPFDVFMAANESFVADLVGRGLIKPGSVRRYARGSLVLAIYHALAPNVRSLDDLGKPVIKKIALANPSTAPYGKAGKQALERLGLWVKLQSKIVMAESVRQALMYAQKGNAEVAFVGRAISNVPEITTIEVDPNLYEPIIQSLGVVAASKRAADAERFARYVLEEEGQIILKDLGFQSVR